MIFGFKNTAMINFGILLEKYTFAGKIDCKITF